MPKESLSIYLTAVDGLSPVLASVTDKTKALDKESQQLEQTYEALQKANKGLVTQKTELQKKLQEVNEEVKEARKNFNALGDEASSDAYSKAQEKQQKLRNEIAATNKALQENQKTYKENIETIRKGSMEGSGSGISGLSSLGALAAGLGAWDQISSLVQSGAGSLLESALGSGAGGIASGALSSAISGATLGTAIAPGIGTAVGAALGGILGAAGGAIEDWSNRDDAFKDYYGGLYDDVKDRSGELVESGSTLASGRQTDRISFKTLFGDEQAANGYLESLVDMANRTPFLYDDLVSMSKTLATYGYNESNILPLLQTIGDTGAALGMGTSDMNSVAQALGRMKSSDKTTLEYLNILNDRGIGAVGMLADAKGVSQGDMYSMISKGEISGREAVEIITAALQEAYTGSMLEQSQTFAGISSTLEGLEQELQNAGGDAYNSLRQSGKSAMVDAYGGELGDAIKEINAVMGENQARRENLQDQYMREVLDRVLNGNRGELWSTFNEEQQNTLTGMSEQYAYLMRRYENGDTDAGAQLESLYEQAQILGQEYFDNSAEVARLNDIEREEIEAVRQNTTGLENAYSALYDLNQTMSKGLVVKGGGLLGGLFTSGTYDEEEPGGTFGNLETHYLGPDGKWARRAFGLDRVPYDDYPALLHEGERVLTANQARAQDAENVQPLAITITGNSFTGTTEDMAYELVQIILQRLTEAGVAAAPK